MIQQISFIPFLIGAALLGSCGGTYPSSPDYMPQIIDLAECEIADDNGSVSDLDVDRCKGARENLASAYYSFGRSAYRNGDYQEAILYYSNAIDIDPEIGYDIYLKRGALRDYLDDEEGAIADYSRAILRKPDVVISYKARGDAYIRTGRYEKALEDYGEAIALGAKAPDIFVLRGFAFGHLGRYEEAISAYDKAIEIKPDYAMAYFNRGHDYAELGRHEEAIAEYNKAIEIKPDYGSAYNNRGNSYAELGRHEEAIADYDKAIALKPNSGRYWRNRSRAKRALGDVEGAIRDCNHAKSFYTGLINCY